MTHNFLAHDCCHTNDCACHSPERTLCCKHAPAKRGNVTGWTRGAVRRHKTWLYSVDVAGLDGEGYGVTLTLRDTPATHDDWRKLVERLHRAFREAGLSRWHWVVEWQRRGTPHLHLAVYAPPGWESPISDSAAARRAVTQAWLTSTWCEVAGEYGALWGAQVAKQITGPQGWLKYLAKHSARGVRHYQRQGVPSGWTGTGRLWGHGGSWPVVEPVAGQVQGRGVRG